MLIRNSGQTSVFDQMIFERLISKIGTRVKDVHKIGGTYPVYQPI